MLSQYKSLKASKLIREMKEWGVRRESLHLAQFLAERNMSFKELNDFCKIAPRVARQLEILKSRMLVNWIRKFEKTDTSRHAVAFGMQCVKNYDLDLLHINSKMIKEKKKTEKAPPKVGSNEIIEDVNVVDDLSNVKLEGEAKDLYELSLKNNKAQNEICEAESPGEGTGSERERSI